MHRSLKTLIIAASASLAAAAAWAQDLPEYPHKVVTFVTHGSPGGGGDTFNRQTAKFLAPILGVDIVVENVRGGGGAKAMAKLAQSPTDGSIFYGSGPGFVTVSIVNDLEFDVKDLDPVANLFIDPLVLFVRKESELNSVTDLVDLMREKGRGVALGAPNPSSLERLMFEQLKAATETEGTVVTHDGGGEMLINVLNGSVVAGIGEPAELAGQLEAGDIRMIGTFTPERLKAFPDVPTISEAGIDISVRKWRAFMAPKGLDPKIKEIWDTAIPKLLADPGFQEWYLGAALVPEPMTSSEIATFMDGYIQDTGNILREFGLAN